MWNGRWAVLFGVMWWSVACNEPLRPETVVPRMPDAGPALVVIGGEAIDARSLTARVERWRAAQVALGRAPSLAQLDQRRIVLARRLADEELVLRAAAAGRRSLPKDIELLAQFARHLGGDAQVAHYLRSTGETDQELVRRLRAEWALEQMIEPVQPRAEDVAGDYEAHRARYVHPEQVLLRRLTLPASARPLADHAVAAPDLAAWVREHERELFGRDVTSGWFERSALPAAVADWSFAAPRGTRAVIERDDVLEAIELVDRRAAASISLPEATAEITARLARHDQDRGRRELLTQLRAQFKVEEPVRDALLDERQVRRERSENPTIGTPRLRELGR